MIVSGIKTVVHPRGSHRAAFPPPTGPPSREGAERFRETRPPAPPPAIPRRGRERSVQTDFSAPEAGFQAVGACSGVALVCTPLQLFGGSPAPLIGHGGSGVGRRE